MVVVMAMVMAVVMVVAMAVMAAVTKLTMALPATVCGLPKYECSSVSSLAPK